MTNFTNTRTTLLLTAVILILTAIASHLFHFRIDLTSEGRYTLSDVTVSYAGRLQEPVVVSLYLEGELNAGFRRLRRQTVELCREVDYHAAHGVRLVSIDPGEMTKEEGTRFEEELSKAGLGGVPVFETLEDGRKTRTIVYPYAKVHVGSRYVWLNLLENVAGLNGEESLNRSIEDLEFKFADALHRLMRTEVPKVAFLEGHGELDELDVMSATEALSEHFNVDRGAIGSDPSVLDPYKVIIIAKPSKPMSEKDKYVIDQYVMRGGRVLWLVDAVTMTLDTLRHAPHTIGLTADLNLSDMLFVYGVRMRAAVVEDMSCGMIPVSVPKPDGGSQIVPMPWLFGPLMSGNANSPVTRNVNLVHADFVSPIDTVGEDLDVLRTPLLRTSAYSRTTEAPVMAQLSTIHRQPDPDDFKQRHLLTAVMQEGSFRSAFNRRRVPAGVSAPSGGTLEKSVRTKMIFVADGDVIRNDVRFRHTSNPTIVPLGYDEISRQNYGNRDFIVNAVQYLADDDGLMALRNRSFALRMLDRQTIGNGTFAYKIAALAVPLLLIGIVCGGVVAARRRTFARKK